LVDDQDGFMFGEDDFTEDEDGHPDALILPNNNFVYHQWESCLPSLENETYDPRDYFEFDNGDDYDNDPHWDAESNPDLYNSFEGYYDEFDEFDYDDIMDGASDFDDDMNGWDDGY
jgi:hypothetical protein